MEVAYFFIYFLILFYEFSFGGAQFEEANGG